MPVSAAKYAELQQKHKRLQLLHQVNTVIHSSLDPQEALQLILRETVRLMRGSSGSVVLINPNTGFLEIQASSGLPRNAAELKLRVGEGLTGWVAQHGQPARVGDVRQDPRYIMLQRDIRSELAVPLEVNGEVRGVLNVDSFQENAFSAEDQLLLESFATMAAQVIRNTWLYEQLRLKARLFESLVSVARAINSASNLDEALQAITHEAASLIDAKMCSLMLLDDSQRWLDLRASFGAGQAYLDKPRLSVDESFIGIVVRRKKPLQLANVQVSGRFQRVDVARKEGLVSLLSVPLLFQDHAIGTLNVYMGRQHNFSNEEIRILCALAELGAIAIEKARLYERIASVEEEVRQNEKLSAIGLLAAEVAHEIRNPLTVMKLLYHSMDLRFPSGDPRIKDARIMGEKMDHLNKIVEQILAFARTAEPQLSLVDINHLIDDLGLLTRHKLNQQKVTLIRRLGESLPLVSADATQLEQAFLNLTLNAVEAMPEGGRLTVTTKILRKPKESEVPTHVLIEFRDTGQGMPEEQRRRAFSSLLSSTKIKGTGLGLAIVNRVVETHRGELKIRSQVGKGTSISIILPV